MLTGKYRRIYYHHLKKCGGSTLNRWLDTMTFAERAINSALWVTPSDRRDADAAVKPVVPHLKRALFHWNDVVHSHGPLLMHSPADTFRFTVIRDPVERLVSQVADLRRISYTGIGERYAIERECVEDSRGLPLRKFLEKHAHRGLRRFLDNHMTRELFAGRIGSRFNDAVEADRLTDVALQSLEMDYDLIGLTECMELSRNALCEMIGLPPAREIPLINVTPVTGRTDAELADARDVLHSLTCADRVIHDRARELFDQRHRRAAEAYDTAAFETNHAARLLAEARGHYCDGATRYSVRAPIIGSGFHGRDAAELASCAVWSGPETRTTLYMPTPSDMRSTLLVWIRGYADSRQRGQIRVRVDGAPAAHQFVHADGYADLLTIDTHSTRDFVRLEIDLDETLESRDRGTDQHDPRRRGFSFDSYGWRPVI